MNRIFFLITFLLFINLIYAQKIEILNDVFSGYYDVQISDSTLLIKVNLRNKSKNDILIPSTNSNYSIFSNNTLIIYIGFDQKQYVNSEINYFFLKSDSSYNFNFIKNISNLNSINGIKFSRNYAFYNDFNKKEIYIKKGNNYYTSFLVPYLLIMKWDEIYIPFICNTPDHLPSSLR